MAEHENRQSSVIQGLEYHDLRNSMDSKIKIISKIIESGYSESIKSQLKDLHSDYEESKQIEKQFPELHEYLESTNSSEYHRFMINLEQTMKNFQRIDKILEVTVRDYPKALNARGLRERPVSLKTLLRPLD